MPTKTTKIADQSLTPKATMASGIQATGAIGASSVTVGNVSLRTIANEKATLPVRTPATKARNRPIKTRWTLATMAVSATKFAPVRSTPTAGIRNWAWLRISPMNSWGGGRMTGSIKWSAAAASHATTTSPIDRTHQTPATTPRMRALERARARDAVVAGRAGAAAG